MSARHANSINKPHVTSVLTRTWIWTQLRRYCDLHWETYCAERGVDPPRLMSRATPATVAVWCRRHRKRRGRQLPVIVGAAACFRSDFVRLVAVALPDVGVELPGSPDQIEKAIADSPNWKSAVRIALADVDRVKEILKLARSKWHITVDTHPQVILDHVQKEYKCRLSNLFKRGKAHLSIFQIKPLTEPGYIVVPVSPENESIVEAFASPSEKMKETTVDILVSQAVGQRLRHTRISKKSQDASDKDQVFRVIGFKQMPEEYLWNLLERNGALAIKAHYALWARWAHEYPKMEFTPEQTLTLTIPQFCDDLGFKRYKGQQRRENVEMATSILKLLTSIELICFHQPAQEPIEMSGGNIWRRAGLPKELTGFEDAWIKTKYGFEDMWMNKAFSYAPGLMFADAEWQKQRQLNARVGAAFLKLQADNRDKYTLKVGGYLVSLARADEYTSTKIRVRTLAERTGLWQVDGRKNVGRMESKLVSALDKLEAIRVIKSFDYESDEKGRYHSGDHWFNQMLVVTWPDSYKAELIELPWIVDKKSWIRRQCD